MIFVEILHSYQWSNTAFANARENDIVVIKLWDDKNLDKQCGWLGKAPY